MTDAHKTGDAGKRETAVFGGGCFWCTEAIFSRIRGVESVTSGYAGGHEANPTYFRVSEEWTGHAEVVRVEFDPTAVSYEQLVKVFFDTHDPTSLNQQGADRGTQYRSIILYTSPEQQKTAQRVFDALQKKADPLHPLVTQIVPLDEFYTAEEYHQKYFALNPQEPYCQVVIGPKLEKFERKYAALLK